MIRNQNVSTFSIDVSLNLYNNITLLSLETFSLTFNFKLMSVIDYERIFSKNKYLKMGNKKKSSFHSMYIYVSVINKDVCNLGSKVGMGFFSY